MDGSHLTDLLLKKNYEVYGIIRRSSSFNTSRIDHIFSKIQLIYGDMTDGLSLFKTINEIKPNEIYNLAAQSHVKISFDKPKYTTDTIVSGIVNLLESVKSIDPKIKIYQSSSSEMFGDVLETPQKESTPFNPQSPYACAKVYAHQLCKIYREAYNMFICCGILFNHESSRRGGTFVTKKICDHIKLMKQWSSLKAIPNMIKLQLGNLSAKRDWGYAKEYIEAMYLMLQQNKPDDYVIATGETHTVEEFCKEAFSQIGIDNYMDYIEINEKYFRPSEVNLLKGDYSKAKRILGWEPKIKFQELVKLMINEDN